MIINIQSYQSNRSQETHQNHTAKSDNNSDRSGTVTTMAPKKRSPAVEKAILRAQQRPW